MVVIAAIVLIATGTVATVAGVGSALEFHRRRHRLKPKKLNPHLRNPAGYTRGQLIAAQKKLGMDTSQYYNIGVCGQRGTGKSAFINALRGQDEVSDVGLENTDMFASAPTGYFETTRNTQCYSVPLGHELELFRFWDIPGCGMYEHPALTYFHDKSLYAFDLLLVVADKGIGEYENIILQTAQKLEIPAIIVVSKGDSMIKDRIRKRHYNNVSGIPISEYRELVKISLEETQVSVKKSLEKYKLRETPAFLISSWKLADYFKLMKDSTPYSVEENEEQDDSDTSESPTVIQLDDEETLEKLRLQTFQINDLYREISTIGRCRRC